MHRLVVALVTLIGLTGVAVVAAYLFLFSAVTDRAAGLAPASSAFYVNVYLKPSAGQQMNLAGLIGRLPGFADEASLDAKVDQVVENLLSATGIDYRTQVKPWLGDQVAIAGWPSAADPTQLETVVLADVKDRTAAESALADLAGQAGAPLTPETYNGVQLQVGDSGAYGFVGEMLAFGTDADALHAVVDTEAGGDPLSERSDFRDAMSRVPADHLASVFVDLAAIAEANGVGSQLGELGIASAALVAEHDGLRLSGSTPRSSAGGTASGGASPGTEPSSLVDWMPETTLAEAVVFGLRGTLEEAEAAIQASPDAGDLASTLDTIRAIAAFGLGLDLDADVLPLLDREVGVAVSGLSGTLPSGQLLLRPSDPDAARTAIARIGERLTAIGATSRDDDHGGVTVTTISIPDVANVAYAVTDGVVILGLSSDDVVAAIDAHAASTTVAASDVYQRAFEVAGTRAGTEAFVDIGAVVDLAGDGLGLPTDARDILGQIGAFGLTLPSRDDQVEFHAVLTVDEPPGAE